MEVSITMSEEEYNFIRAYAEEKNVRLSKFFIMSALEQIETEEDMRLYKESKED